jgi:hypothetical protein
LHTDVLFEVVWTLFGEGQDDDGGVRISDSSFRPRLSGGRHDYLLDYCRAMSELNAHSRGTRRVEQTKLVSTKLSQSCFSTPIVGC